MTVNSLAPGVSGPLLLPFQAQSQASIVELRQAQLFSTENPQTCRDMGPTPTPAAVFNSGWGAGRGPQSQG